MRLSWTFHAKLPRDLYALKIHTAFFLWTSLYTTELILSHYRNVLISFPIQGLFSYLICGYPVLPFVPVVPRACQIRVTSHWEAWAVG